VIEAMGEKTSSRRLAAEAGVPPVPGTLEPASSADDVIAFGEEHGWPVAIKAAYGGGGRGMRVVPDASKASAAFDACRREAEASFGRSEVYLERYLTWPRHIEIQLFADTHGNVVWLGERDCSIQRRHQKIVEETPSPGLPDEDRRSIGEAAVRVARHVGYVNAGTVEFLYQDGQAWFLEMNTRLQVEHPVTEMTTGFDLVAEQLRVAAGRPLSFTQETIERRGHSFECRINAEDPTGGRFLPSPGTITRFSRPGGYGVRVEAGIGVGDTVSQHYDNLLAKIVVWGQDREDARRRMLRALHETVIEGVVTNKAVHRAVLEHPDFIEARYSTRWLEERLDFTTLVVNPPEPAAEPGPSAPPGGPPASRAVRVEVDGRLFQVRVYEPEGRGASRPAEASTRARRRAEAASPAGEGRIVAPMQGTIVSVDVAVGDQVEGGQAVCVLEAMKMENQVETPVSGTVAEVRVRPGDTVGAGDVLVVVE
jgi:acetyl-CoA/propionyl-CoA carboxylase biotin carboxyl carrier protein